MKVIVDANIIFSAILNTNGKIGDLLLNSKGIIEFIAPKYMMEEIEKYHAKLMLLTKLDFQELKKIQFQVFKHITFISEGQVPENYWIIAEKIMYDIDPKDTPYIAFSSFLRIKIWTGDKSLRKGLIKKGIKKCISTDELFEYREIRLRKRKH
ncbi:MAG: hypothetical protein JXB49_26215 [Bacteroidales bacterium]|nr:hypothetical protein [Bacteroidales bacterium]